MIDLERGTLILMSEVQKQDCLTIEAAASELHTSKQTVYTYVNYLGIKRVKFPLDRKVYIAKSDVDLIRSTMQANRGQ